MCMAPCLAQVEPQNEQLPLGYSAVLSAFEKVLVLRMLRPDKVRCSAGGGGTYICTVLPVELGIGLR